MLSAGIFPVWLHFHSLADSRSILEKSALRAGLHTAHCSHLEKRKLHSLPRSLCDGFSQWRLKPLGQFLQLHWIVARNCHLFSVDHVVSCDRICRHQIVSAPSLTIILQLRRGCISRMISHALVHPQTTCFRMWLVKYASHRCTHAPQNPFCNDAYDAGHTEFL